MTVVLPCLSSTDPVSVCEEEHWLPKGLMEVFRGGEYFIWTADGSEIALVKIQLYFM